MDKEISVEDVFSLRRPRDIRAGIASGLKSVAKGVVGGTVGLLAAPTVGAVQDGLPGFAKGVAAGVAGAVLLPIAGASVAAIQVTRGIINQPEAITASIKGKAWDQEHRCWVHQPHSALTTYDAAAASHWHRLGISGILGYRQQQVDYYELLEVPRDAAAEHIKRQYYRLARRHHPDKNAGDSEAHQRFQQLGEAYQVLSNPALRQQYDKHGAEGLHTDDLMDSAAFFACLFGSEMFDHLIGELALATFARLGDDATAAELQDAPLQRVQQLSVYLVALLRRYVEGDAEGFRLAMQQEAQRLAAASFGVTLLHCIGAVYSNCADIYLGGFVGGTLARVRQGTETLRCHLNVAGAALKVLAHQDKLAAFDRDREEQRQQQQQQQQQQQAGGEDLNHIQQPLHDDQQQQQGCGGDGSMGCPADLLYDSVWFGQRGSVCSNGIQHDGGNEPQQLEQHAVDAGNGSSSSVASTTCGSILKDMTESPPELLDHLFDRLPLHGCGPNGLARTASGTAIAAGAGETGGAATVSRATDATACMMACRDAALSDNPASLSAADGNGFQQSNSKPGSSPPPAAAATADQTAADDASSNIGPDQISMDELLERSQLEELSIQLCMDAMWAANVVDIYQTLGRVCREVLYDAGNSSKVQRLRAQALRELGTIFSSVSEPDGAPQAGARQQVQAAYEAMLAKQLAQQDAEDTTCKP